MFPILQTLPIDTVTNTIAGNVSWLVIGIIFFAAAALVIHFLKNLVVNAVLGVVGWALLTYVFHVAMPFYPSLFVSAIFGLAGLGAMVVLGFLGIV